MPWLASTITPGGSFGVLGTLGWFRPDAASSSEVTNIPIPSVLKPVDQQVSWCSDGVSAFNCGGFTDNAILTKHWQLWALSIRAPDVVPTVALVAGPGITANVICYLRWYDEKTGERSPLSAPSGTLAAANQQVQYTSLDTITAPERVTHIEAWESRDGGLPRFVWRRQLGIVSVTHGLALGSLGEAETSDWTKPPRCRFGVIWHGRLVLAGNDQDPTTLYFMDIGFPERWSGLTLSMKSGQPIVGLAEINGNLLAFGPFVTEIVSGWTEDDLKIDIRQPDKGLISHFGLMHVDTWLIVPTHEQPYMTDGTSWVPIGDDIKSEWVAEFASNREAYQKMWAHHLPDEHCVRWYVGSHSKMPISENTLWVLDYDTLIRPGGIIGPPRWTYDGVVQARSCGAVLAVPGGRRKIALTGASSNGRIFTESVENVLNGADDGVDLNQMEIVTPAMHFGEHGGPEDHALRLEDLTVLLRSEFVPWELAVYSGDVECYVPPELFSGNGFTAAFGPEVVPASEVEDLQPEWTHHFGSLPNVTGRAFTIRITCDNPIQAAFAGLVGLRQPGITFRQPGRDSGGGV